MKKIKSILYAWIIFLGVIFLSPVFVLCGNYATSPHGNTSSGVSRIVGLQTGSCRHCHYLHYSYGGSAPTGASHPGTDAGGPLKKLLFKDTSATGDNTCFATQCHGNQPNDANCGYPLTESDVKDTLSDSAAYPRYYECNTADTKDTGLTKRGRWSGQTVWTNARSTHYNSVNMNEKDASGKGKCSNCHNQHGSQSSYDMLIAKNNTGGIFDSKTNPYIGIKNSGTNTTTYGTSNYALCFSCHSEDATARNAGMSNAAKYIGNYFAISDNQAGHQIRKNANIATSWPAWVSVGDKLACSACHNPHSNGNNNQKLISDNVGGNTVSNFDPTVASSVRGLCLSCHCNSDAGVCNNTVAGITMKQLPAKTQHTIADGTSCFNCHGNDYSNNTARNVHHPSRGESIGGQNCNDCHSAIVSAMQDNTTYHHVLEATTATYPTNAAPAADSVDKKCLMCHADHDIFRPDLNSPGGARGSNLRTDIALTPTASPDANFTNTDFVNSGSGGICLSCHLTNAETKDYSGTNVEKNDTQTTTAMTVPLWGGVGAIADYNSSAHNYTVTATFTSDSSNFLANCIKCHSDDTTKNYQNSTYKFALHYINERRLLNPLGAALGDPMEQTFCFQCHSNTCAAGNDYYGVQAMTANAKCIQTAFSYTYGHIDIATYSGRHKPTEATTDYGSANRHVECPDCHNPHTTQIKAANGDGKALIGARGLDVTFTAPPAAATDNKGNFAAGAGYTYTMTTVTSTTPKQQEYKICMKCHSNYAVTLPASTDFFGRVLAGGRNIAEEINPGNASYHGIVPVNGVGAAKGQDVGALHNNRINSFPTNLLSTYNNVRGRFPVAGLVATVYCSDCHTLDPATNAEGPHTSNIDKILIATITSTQAGGTPLCLQCHSGTDGSYWGGGPANSAATRHDSTHSTANTEFCRGCFTCHMWNFASCGYVYGAGPPASAFNANYTGAGPTYASPPNCSGGAPAAGGWGNGGIFVHGMNKRWYYKDYGNETSKQGTKSGTNCGTAGAVNAGNLLSRDDGFLDGFQATEDYVAYQCWTEVCRIHTGAAW